MKKIFSLILGLVLGVISVNAQLPVKQVADISRQTLLDVTNETIDSSYLVLYITKNHYALDVNISGDVSCKAFMSLDEELSDDNETGWVDYNTDFFSADSMYNTHTIRYQGDFFSPLKIMLKFRNVDDTNYKKVILQEYN